MGILELVAAFQPSAFFFAGKPLTFGTPYYALTIGMNVLLTLLVSSRLFYLARKVRKVMGLQDAEPYTNFATILIESAALYTIVGVILLPLYASGHDMAVCVGQVWSKMTVSVQ